MNNGGYQSELNLNKTKFNGNLSAENLVGSYGVATVTIPINSPPGPVEVKDYALNLDPPISDYAEGMLLRVLFSQTNGGGAATIDVNSLGAKAIKKLIDGNLVDLDFDELPDNEISFLHYNGTEFQLLFKEPPYRSTESVVVIPASNINPGINLSPTSQTYSIFNQTEIHSRGLIIEPIDQFNTTLTNMMVLSLPAPVYGATGRVTQMSEGGSLFTIYVDLKGRIVVNGSFQNTNDRLVLPFPSYVAKFPYEFSPVIEP